MQRINFLIIAGLISGCATMHKTDPETGLEVSYSGPARGAVEMVRVTDGRPYDLAESAMDKGMPTSLARDADGDVRFTAGYGGYTAGYGGYPTDGTVPSTGVYVPGQGLVPTGPISTLPVLANPQRIPPPQATSSQATVPCPTDRSPATPAEQAACALMTARTALEQSTPP